jgi:hypothetical protein
VASVDVTSLPAMIPPAAWTATTFTVTSADVNVVPGVANLRYGGFSCRETAGLTALFNIKNDGTGGGSSTTIIETVSLGPNESTGEHYDPAGIASAGGISIDWVSGSITGVVFSKIQA